MPIIRRDEESSNLSGHVLFLWRKKWWMLLPAIAVFVLTYVVMLAIPDEFKTSAELYVNRLLPVNNSAIGIPNDPPNPAAVAKLLNSNAVLLKVRDEYVKQFNLPKPPIFERFASQFSVKTEIMQDTSLRKDVAPIITLQVQSVGKQGTQFLMNSWMKNFVAEYGNYAVAEAVQKREDLLKQDEQLDGELRKLEGEQARVSAELPLQEKLLAEKMDLIAPAEMPPVPADNSAQAEDRSMSSNMRVVIQQSLAQKQPGLLSRLTGLQFEKARAAAGGKVSSSPAELGSETAALESLISETQTSVTALQSTVADLRQKLSSVSRDIKVKTETQQKLHVYLDTVNAVASTFRPSDHGEMPGGADIRTLSLPVEPELKVWPRRTLSSGIAALAAIIICMGALLFNRFLEESTN